MVTEKEAGEFGGLDEFHLCRRWWDRNMRCPMSVFRDHARDPKEAPDADLNEPFRILLAAKSEEEQNKLTRGLVLSQAEDIVAAAARGIPIEEAARAPGVREPVPTLGDRLMDRGPLAVGIGVAAGAAIRGVAKGFAGGGFHFPQVFDPMRPIRAR